MREADTRIPLTSDLLPAGGILALDLVSIAALEEAIAVGRGEIGALGYACLGWALITIASVGYRGRASLLVTDRRSWTAALCFSLALVAGLRLVSLGLPSLDQFSRISPIAISSLAWPTTVGVLCVLVAALAYAAFLPATAAGTRRWWMRRSWDLSWWLVSLSGIPLSLGLYFLMSPRPEVTGLSVAGGVAQSILLLDCVAFPEELLYRGLIQRVLGVYLGRGAILLSALLYTVAFAGMTSPVGILVPFSLSLLFGWHVWRSGSLAPATIAHGLLLVGCFLVWPSILAG